MGNPNIISIAISQLDGKLAEDNMTMMFGHANRQELDVLDSWQGAKRHYDDSGNVRFYDVFEASLQDANFRKILLLNIRQSFATGGQVKSDILTSDEIEYYRSLGRNGDDCLMVMGPYLRSFLETVAGSRGSINPVTKFPEFFSLGGMFSGLWNGVKNGVSSIGHTLAPMLPGIGTAAGTLIGSRMGNPALGAQIGGMAGGMGQNLFGGGQGQPQGMPQQQPQEMGGQGGMPQQMQQPQEMGGQGGMPQQQPNMMDYYNSSFGGQNQFNPQQFIHQGMNAYQGGQGGGIMPALQKGFQGAGGFNGMLQSGMDAYNRYRNSMNPQGAM